MANIIKKIRCFLLDVAQLRLLFAIPGKLSKPRLTLGEISSSISFKLALLIITLVAVTAGSISMVVISIMSDVQLQSMLKRGSAISNAAASPAGYSILAGDRLALDNLVAQICATQPDLDYITIIDNDDRILAHNQLELTGTDFQYRSGLSIDNSLGLNVNKISSNNVSIYEFIVPIRFSDKTVGYVVTGLNAAVLETARTQARNKIILIITLLFLLAVSGAFLLSRLFTYPIKQLSEGVARIQSGEEPVVVPITAKDELATLTRSFNEMSKKITVQRQSLVDYSEELEQSYADIVRILAAALDARDNYTFGHSSRVAQFSVGIGRKLMLDPCELNELEMACMLHDIGKIRIPDTILNKPGKLSNEEYQSVRNHPHHGIQILELADSLKKYIPSVLHHHEWHDGTGYPDKLAGNEIPLHAMIISIADTYDAMTSSRPYRQGMSRNDAVEELIRFKGRQFRPELIDLFLESLEEYGDVCDLPLAGGATG